MTKPMTAEEIAAREAQRKKLMEGFTAELGQRDSEQKRRLKERET